MIDDPHDYYKEGRQKAARKADYKWRDAKFDEIQAERRRKEREKGWHSQNMQVVRWIGYFFLIFMPILGIIDWFFFTYP